MSPLDWGRLAPVWKHFASTGLRAEDLEPFGPRLRGPSVLVGSGQGLVTAGLRRHAPPVLALDRAPGMVFANPGGAGAAGGRILADGIALPVADGRAGSAVLNTGVLDPSHPELGEALLAELRRVLRPGGRALVAGFVPSGDWEVAARELGLLDGCVQRNDRILALWREARNPAALIGHLMAWTGCPPLEVAARLQRHRAHAAGLVQLFDRVAADLAALGHDPARYLEECYAGPFPVFAPEPLRQAVRDAGLAIEEESDPAATRGILLLLCRKPE
ncbi:MAG TPA: class I SAM-dependent methyltransferase [Thermoanaerobaculia bacterium]|nr:class I SAM-dependent methyltransferase [Thermoanaerobaculia bacterium]